MGISEWANKAKRLAQSHSAQVDKAADRVERTIDERTGHRYDDQVEKGMDQVQRQYGGGEGDPPEQGR
jgi:hypothetical protein